MQWTYTGRCWGCDVVAALISVSGYEHEQLDERGYPTGLREHFTLMRCPSCGTPSVVGQNDHGDEPYLMMVGLAGKEFDDVPSPIAAAATEATRCLAAGLYRATEILARSTVEAVCKDQGATRGTLQQKIAKLAEEKRISPIVFDEVDQVRASGNDMAHGDFLSSPSQSDAELTVAWMQNLLQDIYQRPAQVQRRAERRKKPRAITSDGGEN